MSKTKSYFVMQVSALRLCGISLNENDTTLYKIVSKVPFCILCLYPFLAVGDLFKNDLETASECITYIIPFFVGVIKGVLILLNSKRLMKILRHLDGDLSLRNYVNGDNQNEILVKRCITITTAQTAVYWSAALFSVLWSSGESLIIRIRSSDYHDWKFPYGKFSILNVTYSSNFEISWAYQSMSACYFVILYQNTDLILAAVLCHICCHLKILQNNLKCVVENAYRNRENFNTLNTPLTVESFQFNDYDIPTTDWSYLLTSLNEQVKYHLKVIHIAGEVRELFSMVLLFVVFGTLATQSVMLYRTSLVSSTDAEMWQHVGQICTSTLQIFMVAFWSEQMLFEGEQVGYAAYQSNFVGTDLRFQKSLMLIMRRSQYPIRLHAGYFNVSMATFTWISQTTYSYFMILRNYNLREY